MSGQLDKIFDATEKRGRGQPPKPPEAKRSVRIVAYVTPPEAEAINAKAREAGETASDVARGLLLRFAGLVKRRRTRD